MSYRRHFCYLLKKTGERKYNTPDGMLAVRRDKCLCFTQMIQPHLLSAVGQFIQVITAFAVWIGPKKFSMLPVNNVNVTSAITIPHMVSMPIVVNMLNGVIFVYGTPMLSCITKFCYIAIPVFTGTGYASICHNSVCLIRFFIFVRAIKNMLLYY